MNLFNTDINLQEETPCYLNGHVFILQRYGKFTVAYCCLSGVLSVVFRYCDAKDNLFVLG